MVEGNLWIVYKIIENNIWMENKLTPYELYVKDSARDDPSTKRTNLSVNFLWRFKK